MFNKGLHYNNVSLIITPDQGNHAKAQMRIVIMKNFNFVLELNCGTNIGAKKDRVLTADVIEALNYINPHTVVLADKIFLDEDENTVFLRFEWPSIGCTAASLQRLADDLCVMLGQAAMPLQCLNNDVQVMGVCDANKPSVWRDEWSEFNIDYFQRVEQIELLTA